MTSSLRLVLASASSGRLATLRNAGLTPEVVISGVDEEGVRAPSPAALAQLLATRKCRAVAGRLEVTGTTVVVGCDSVLELDGEPYGKPGDAETAVARWEQMRGRSGVLHSGHCVQVLGDAPAREAAAVGSTVVHFATLSDAEIAAYVATGEPLQVAGAFTLDGLGGPFVRAIEGDPSNVVGVSLPLLRVLLGQLDVRWPSLW
jgi:septum formation protein